MPSTTIRLVENVQISNQIGPARAVYVFNIGNLSAVSRALIRCKVHAEPKNIIGSPSSCNVFVVLTNDYINSSPSRISNLGYEVVTVTLPSPIPGLYYAVNAVVIAKGYNVPFCSYVQTSPSSDITDIIDAGENKVIVIFDISSWGTGSGGTINYIYVDLEYEEEVPPYTTYSIMLGGTEAGESKGVMEDIVKIINPIITIIIMLVIVKLISGVFESLGERRRK